MNNWRLLLFAVVAVLQPIGSFTERNLIDGRRECCDHGSDARDTKLYGTFRESVHDQRLGNRILTDHIDTRETRRYETRESNPLLTRAVEKRTTESKRSSRYQERRQRGFPNSIRLEQSQIRRVFRTDTSRYGQYSETKRHTPIDSERLSQAELRKQDLRRDYRVTRSDGRINFREANTERIVTRTTENRRTTRENIRDNKPLDQESQVFRSVSRQDMRENESRASRESLNERNNERSARNLVSRATERRIRDIVSEERRDDRTSQRNVREKMMGIRDSRFDERNNIRQSRVSQHSDRDQRQRNLDDEKLNSRVFRQTMSLTSHREEREVISRNDAYQRVQQRRDREINRMSTERVTLRLNEPRESRDRRLEPEMNIRLSRNIRSVQNRDERSINERYEQKRERVTNTISENRLSSQREESQMPITLSQNRVLLRQIDSRQNPEQRQESQRTILSRSLKYEHSRGERKTNERTKQIQEREANRIAEDRLMPRQHESRGNPERRLEYQRTESLSRNFRSELSRNERRANERVELRRDTNRLPDERLMSRLRESRQNPEQRLESRRSGSLSRIEDIGSQRESSRRQNNRIDERFESRLLREQRDSLIRSVEHESHERRNLIRKDSRTPNRAEMNEERLVRNTLRIAAGERQDSQSASPITVTGTRDTRERIIADRSREFRDSRSAQREDSRDRRISRERIESRRKTEINSERASRDFSRTLESRLREQRSRSAIPSSLRDYRNERVSKNRDSHNREVQRELKSERRDSMDIRSKTINMAMERIDQIREAKNRIQNGDYSRIRETMTTEKSEKQVFEMNWQYVFYTLQGAYLCGLLVQMLTEKSINSKTKNFTWWRPISNNLIKVD